MSYTGRDAWDACWTLEADHRKPVSVATIERDGTTKVAIRVGTTGVPALIGPADAQVLRGYLQAAIDESELSKQLAARKEPARSNALHRLDDCVIKGDTAGRDAAIIDAIDAGMNFAKAADAAGLDRDLVREVWRAQLALDERQ